MTRKGPVTLPKAVRTALGLQAGSRVVFTIQDDRVVLEKLPPTDAISPWRGYLKCRVPHCVATQVPRSVAAA